MDRMLGEMDNLQKDTANSLKDSHKPLGIALKDTPMPISYKKTNNLIMALYMVTDIMDSSEPIRTKLRTLGSDVLSDMYRTPFSALAKISEILSFLDIAQAVNLVSEMNANILRREFFELEKAIKESAEPAQDSSKSYKELDIFKLFKSDYQLPSGSYIPTRLGVQNAGSLMNALKKIDMSDRKPVSDSHPGQQDFELTKKERREEIIHIIRMFPGGATIGDIKSKATGKLAQCGEKTLQRELVSLAGEGVLKKTGSKRWSRYSVVG